MAAPAPLDPRSYLCSLPNLSERAQSDIQLLPHLQPTIVLPQVYVKTSGLPQLVVLETIDPGRQRPDLLDLGERDDDGAMVPARGRTLCCEFAWEPSGVVKLR